MAIMLDVNPLLLPTTLDTLRKIPFISLFGFYSHLIRTFLQERASENGIENSGQMFQSDNRLSNNRKNSTWSISSNRLSRCDENFFYPIISLEAGCGLVKVNWSTRRIFCNHMCRFEKNSFFNWLVLQSQVGPEEWTNDWHAFQWWCELIVHFLPFQYMARSIKHYLLEIFP